MTTYEDLYNSLPTVFDADSRFVNRDAVLTQLAPLLSKFQYQFGVCLVHAHCKVELGEKMIATGNVTQPEDAASFAAAYYPERWLSTGEPYEFTTTPTANPPAELLSEFHKAVAGVGVLGLYFVGTPRVGSWVERTEGRRNIMEPAADNAEETPNQVMIQTAWVPKVELDGTVSGIGKGPHTFCAHCRHCRYHR
jgi:hypothetical protein